MTAPVAPGMDQNLPLPQAASPEIRISAADAPIRAIAPGTTLQVTVRRDPQGGTGVVIDGKFLAAKLPDNLADGQTLAVRVFPSQDALVLKIVDPARLTGEKLIAQTFEQILRTLLPDLQVEDLRNGAPFAQEKLSAELLKSLFGASTPGKGAPSIDTKFAQILEKLIRQNSVIAEPILNDPSSLEKVLSKLAQSNVLPGIQDATRALADIARNAPSAPLLRLTAALQEHVATMLQTKGELDFTSAGAAEKVLSQQLKIYLLASQTAIESGNTQVLKALSQDMNSVRRLENPLSVIISLLKNVDLPGDIREGSKPLMLALRGALVDLQRLKDSGASDKEIRETLKRIMVRLAEAREPYVAQSKDSASFQQFQRTMKNIENVSVTQNTLHQMNAVMQALGEPTLVFFPAILQGLFSTWQFSFKRAQEAEDESKHGGHSGGVRAFERIELFVNLPHLGPLEINLAHRKGEILLNMTASSKQAGDVIQAGGAKLEKVFKGLGYAKASVNTVVGSPQGVTPSWYQELSRRSIVA